jgi:hypothetical protein
VQDRSTSGRNKLSRSEARQRSMSVNPPTEGRKASHGGRRQVGIAAILTIMGRGTVCNGKNGVVGVVAAAASKKSRPSFRAS